MSRIIVSKKLVLLNSASSALSLLVSLVLLVWLQQYLLKRISAEEYSLLPMVMAIMSFIPLLSVVLSGGIGRYVTVAYTRNDDEQVTRICSTMLPLLSGAALALMLVGGAISWNIDWLLKLSPAQISDARLMMALLFFAAAIQLPAAAYSSGFMVRQQLMLGDLISFASQLLRCALLFILLFGVSTRVLWVIVATVIATIARVVFSVIYSKRLVPAQRFRKSAIHWPLAREVIGYGSWSLVNQVAITARDAMDPLILNRFATASDVASFHVGGMPGRQLQSLALPLARPFVPVLASLHASGDVARFRNVYLRGARYHAWAKLTIGVPAIIFASEVMNLYLDGKYPIAGPIMAILVAVQVLLSFNALGPAAAMAKGEVKPYAIRQLATHLFNLVLTLILVAGLHLGAIGASVASLAALLLVNSTLTWTFCRELTQTTFAEWNQQVLLPTLVPALVPVSICLLAKWQLPLDSWFSVLGFSAFSALVYVLTIITFSLTAADKRDLLQLSKKLPAPLRRLLRLPPAEKIP